MEIQTQEKREIRCKERHTDHLSLSAIIVKKVELGHETILTSFWIVVFVSAVFH